MTEFSTSYRALRARLIANEPQTEERDLMAKDAYACNAAVDALIARVLFHSPKSWPSDYLAGREAFLNAYEEAWNTYDSFN